MLTKSKSMSAAIATVFMTVAGASLTAAPAQAARSFPRANRPAIWREHKTLAVIRDGDAAAGLAQRIGARLDADRDAARLCMLDRIGHRLVQ